MPGISIGEHAGVLLLGLCLTLLSSGCTTVSSADPPISDSVYVDILVDLHLAQASIDEGVVSDTTLRQLVLAEHGVSENEMVETTDFYAERGEDFLAIYNRVIDKIAEEQQSAK